MSRRSASGPTAIRSGGAGLAQQNVQLVHVFGPVGFFSGTEIRMPPGVFFPERVGVDLGADIQIGDLGNVHIRTEHNGVQGDSEAAAGVDIVRFDQDMGTDAAGEKQLILHQISIFSKILQGISLLLKSAIVEFQI